LGPALPLFVDEPLARALLVELGDVGPPDPATLLGRLRGRLAAETPADLGAVAPGAYVELAGEIVANPAEEIFQVLARLFAVDPGALSAEDQVGLSVFRLVAEEMRAAPTRDLLLHVDGPLGPVVLVARPGLEAACGMPVRVLGKVVQSWDDGQAYSLLRASSLAVLAQGMLKVALDEAIRATDLPIAAPDLEVVGPSLRLLPLAAWV
jgi:hypothetical protein